MASEEPQWGQPYTDALQAEVKRLREQLAATEKQRRIFEELSKLNASERADEAEALAGRLREQLNTRQWWLDMQYLLADRNRLREQLDAARATLAEELEQKAEAIIRASALREQLDAARQALAEYEKAVQEALEIAPRHWQRYRDTFELGGEIRAARVVGRAALGVEGRDE